MNGCPRWLRGWPAIMGTPEEVVEQIRAYEAVGVTDIEVKWIGADDIEGQEILATEVLPQVTSSAGGKRGDWRKVIPCRTPHRHAQC